MNHPRRRPGPLPLIPWLTLALVGGATARAADPPKPAAVLRPDGLPPERLKTVTWIGFSPDGGTLMVRYQGGWSNTDSDLVAWKTGGWKEQGRWSLPASMGIAIEHPHACLISGEGRVAAVTFGGVVTVPAAAAAKWVTVTQSARNRNFTPWPYRHLFPGPDGSTCLLTTDENRFVLDTLDLAGGRNAAELVSGTVRRTADIAAAALDRAGRWLAVGSRWGGPAELWSVPDRQRVADLAGHDGGVSALAFSPDGRTLASGGEEGTVRLWDVPTGKQRHVLTDPKFTVVTVAFSDDGKRLVFASTDRVGTPNLWVADPATGKVLGHLATSTGRAAALRKYVHAVTSGWQLARWLE